MKHTPPLNPARPVPKDKDYHGLTALEAVALAILPALITHPASQGPRDCVEEAFDVAETFFAESEKRHIALAVKDQESRRTHTKDELKASAEGKAP